MTTCSEERAPRNGVGMPAVLYLDDFGKLIHDAFGDYPYHVGSSMVGTQWRDVDVRLILADDIYAALGLGEPNDGHRNAKWRALVLAFSALGSQMTGLPIDFQIQQRTFANERFVGCRRSALGIQVQLARQGAMSDTGDRT